MSQVPLHVTSLTKDNMADRAFCHSIMGRHMVVSRVAVFEALPTYLTGKADLLGLRGLRPGLGPLASLSMLTST